jgi:hypothetical protein
LRSTKSPRLIDAGLFFAQTVPSQHSDESEAVLESHRRLAAHLRTHASAVDEITYPNVGHMGIMLALAPGFRHRAPLRENIARFVAEH